MRLRHINPALQGRARQALKAGDVGGFFAKTDSMNYMVLLYDNADEFRKRGLFEQALLCAWSGQKSTVERMAGQLFSWGRFVREDLKRADRQKLLEFSDPLPEGDPLKIYRGVWGKKPNQEVRGISWTLSLEIAKRFAAPFKIDGGSIYTTKVKRSDVFAYLDESGRTEQEVLVILPDSHPIDLFESGE